MLGKRNMRARAFSTCHAAILAGFIVVAHIMGFSKSGDDMHLSDQNVVSPIYDGAPLICMASENASSGHHTCALFVKTDAHQGSASAATFIWRFGVRL
mgnify:CR=1 FL=1